MFAVLLAAIAVDFTAETGTIRPALHSSGFGPTICSQTERDLEDVKSMGFKYARTHDWALIGGNQRICDYFHIFPLPHLDAKDPRNYWFKPTDYILKRTREDAGLDVLFRLGTSIEHSGKKHHFNSVVPEDLDKVAETFAATIRHYNRGWADGFHWNIKYWEIWNEPEGYMSMWCPPEGVEGLSPEELEAKRAELKGKFIKFFVATIKRLKSEFGDTIKVGGPAHCSYTTGWLNDDLKACRDAGVAPDFISWHGYARDPMRFNREADLARAMCDSYGFTKCELIVDEWHYFGENYSWKELQHSSDPADKERLFNGPDGHNGIRSACFILATLANMQRSKLDQAYYYGCSHTGSWGFKDALQNKYKVYYALKLFGDIVKGYTVMCKSTSEGTVTTFAVKNAAGKKALLVVDYGGTNRRMSLSVKGVPAGAQAKGLLLDHTHNLTPIDVSLKGSSLQLVKPDFHSAAFFITFEG